MNLSRFSTVVGPLLLIALTGTCRAEGSASVESLNALCGIKLTSASYKAASNVCGRAAAEAAKTDPGTHDEAVSLIHLAQLQSDLGHGDQVLALLKRAETIDEQSLAATDPTLALSLDNIAVLTHLQGDANGAEILYKHALSILDLAPEHNETALASTLNDLGLLYSSEHRYAEAVPLLSRAVEIDERTVGAGDAASVMARKNLKAAQDGSLRPDEALGGSSTH